MTPCSYDHNGVLTGQAGAARTVGTTVAVRELFKRLPVRWAVSGPPLPLSSLPAGAIACALPSSLPRHALAPLYHVCWLPLSIKATPYPPTPPGLLARHKEFLRHIRREYSRLVSVLQAYAVIRCGGRPLPAAWPPYAPLS